VEKKTEKLKSKKRIYSEAYGKQSGESVESVLTEEVKEGYGGKDSQKRKVFSLE